MRILALIFIFILTFSCLSGCKVSGRNDVNDSSSDKPKVDKNGKPVPPPPPPTTEEKAVHGVLITLAIVSLLGIVAGGVMTWLSPAKKTGVGLAIVSAATLFFALSLGRNLEKWENWFDRGLVTVIVLAIIYGVLTHISKLKAVIKDIEFQVKN